MKNGYTYSGKFANGKINGKGVLTSSVDLTGKTKSWSGNFVDGKLEGQGTFTDTDGTTKTGQYKNGEVQVST